jgi:hypothetical protein
MNPTRVRLATLMDATTANKADWHYAQFRPCGAHVTYEDAVGGTVWADCSAGAAIIARLAGAPNPLHAGPFDGYGNTGSCWEHLDHIPLASVQVGDCVVYGPGPNGTHHMAMVRDPVGTDPLLWSNGWEGAPELIRYSTEKARQGSSVTCCRLMPPDPTPTPLPKVDPFWAWLRWYLGEGEFKGHKREKALRPDDAPAVIPPTWWMRERRFLARRNGAKA